MWFGKFTEGFGIKGYNIPLRINMKAPVYYTDKTKDSIVTATLKIINRTDYKKLTLSQEYTVFSQVIE